MIPATSCLAVVVAVVGWAAQRENPTEQQPKKIVQGGYVEIVEPGVDYKDRLPRIPPREPAESIKAFHIVPGYQIQLVAAEPLVRDPVDLAFDEKGRLYVAEMISYAQHNSSRLSEPIGRVSLLEDLDHDGIFDKSTVFVDGLLAPTGLLCYDGGVFVASAPDILYCKDTDGDGQAEVKEVVFTGFSLQNPNALPNSLRWGLDNRVYVMVSTAGAQLEALRWARTTGKKIEPVSIRGRDFSFDPRTGQFRLESGGGQFGMTFDCWGNRFESSNSIPIEQIMYEDRYLARNPALVAPPARQRIWTHGMQVFRTSQVEPWRVIRTEMRVRGVFSGPVEGGGKPAGYFTAACGVYIYQGNAMPELQGDAFVAEGASNIVHHMRLRANGIEFRASRVEIGKEFLASDEIWFRPINFTDAPDGALYFADMYREVFEHPDAIPPSVKKYLDLTSGCDRGRIYRIVPVGFKQPPPVDLSQMRTPELVRLLEHTNGWLRTTASRLIYERQDEHAVPILRKLAVGSLSALARVHALYALDGLGRLDEDTLLAALADSHSRVREHAVRLAEKLLDRSARIREVLYKMVNDPAIRVRYQLAFTLGEIPGPRAARALAEIVRKDVANRWSRFAVLTSCYGRAGDLLCELLSDPAWARQLESRQFLRELAEQVGLQNQADQVAVAVERIEMLQDKDPTLAAELFGAVAQGLKRVGSPLVSTLLDASGKSQVLLADMVAKARTTALDESQPIEKRAAAVRQLAVASFEEVRDVLQEALQGYQPQPIQLAAVQTLNRFRDQAVAQMLIEAWSHFTPRVRGEAAEVLLARPERILALLEAIESGQILPSQLDPARLQLLAKHSDSRIAQRASKILSVSKLAPREQVVAQWRDVLTMSGNPERGREVFRRECAKCHKLEGYGTELGMPLDSIRNRGPEAILIAILDPNRDVLPQYVNYVVVTTDGLSITGIIEEETATSITLKRAEGESDTVLRSQIEELVNTGLSLMPEGQEKLLTKQEMADLISYLMSIQ